MTLSYSAGTAKTLLLHFVSYLSNLLLKQKAASSGNNKDRI
jgi:hypothetical protein